MAVEKSPLCRLSITKSVFKNSVGTSLSTDAPRGIRPTVGIFTVRDELSAPVTPSLVVGSLDGPTSKTDDLLIGEEFVGTISGARGIYVEQLNSSKVSFAYLNKNVFQQKNSPL